MTEVAENEVTARDELYEIASLYREADETEKEAKGQKEVLRDPFFELISEIVREEVPLARQVVKLSAAELDPFEHDAKAWAATNYPEWNLVGFSPGAQESVATLEENDQLKKFEFEYDGFKFGRTVAMQGASFEVEKFYAAIDGLKDLPLKTRKALKGLVEVETVKVYKFDEKAAEKLMVTAPETVTVFQTYSNPGTPQVRMLPIKPVKESS